MSVFLLRAPSADRRHLTHRLVTLGVVVAAAAGLGLAPLTSSADPAGDKARLDRDIAQLRAELEDTSQDLVNAYVQLRRTQALLPAAQKALAAAAAKLAAAERHHQEVATALEVAKAREGKAADALASNAREAEQTQNLIGNMAADQYQSGGIGGLAIALDAQSPQDFTDRMILVDTMMRIQGDALRRLSTVQAEGRAEQSHLVAVRRQVADLKVQAEAAVAAAVRARGAATAAKVALDTLVADQARAAAAVAAKKAGERARLARMQADSGRLEAVLAARAKAARERAAREAAARAAAARAGRRAVAAPRRSGSGAISRPVSAPVTSEFGMRFHPILGYSRLHAGIDFGASCGTPTYAAAGGQIISAGWAGGYGNRVIVDHGLTRGTNLTTTYNHLTRFVRTSGRVGRGQLIAYSGTTGLSTGCHLHFETRQDGRPVNPRTWF